MKGSSDDLSNLHYLEKAHQYKTRFPEAFHILVTIPEWNYGKRLKVLDQSMKYAKKSSYMSQESPAH